MSRIEEAMAAVGALKATNPGGLRKLTAIAKTVAAAAEVLEKLPGMRREHDRCEDPFYSCLKLRCGDPGDWVSCEEGEVNDANPCTCGADKHNAKLDELERLLRGDR